MTLPALYHWLVREAGEAATEWLTFEQLCREANIVIEEQSYE